ASTRTTRDWRGWAGTTGSSSPSRLPTCPACGWRSRRARRSPSAGAASWSIARSCPVSPIGARGNRRWRPPWMAELPPWARWNTAAADRPWTVGVEEEVMLLDERTRAIANRVDEVLAVLPPELAEHASAETHACVVELKTAPHARVGDVAAELARLRPAVDRVLRDELGL